MTMMMMMLVQLHPSFSRRVDLSATDSRHHAHFYTRILCSLLGEIAVALAIPAIS